MSDKKNRMIILIMREKRTTGNDVKTIGITTGIESEGIVYDRKSYV